MTAWKMLLPLVIMGLAGAALAQDANSQAAPSEPPPLRVIVPWTHFGQQPANAPATDPPPPQTSDEQLAPPQSDNVEQAATQGAEAPAGAIDPVQSNDAGPAATNTPATAPGNQATPNGKSIQIYEEDISKKHPHPPEPVKLPLAVQNTAPLSTLEPEAIQISPGGQKGVSQPTVQTPSTGQAAARLSSADNLPQSQIEFLMAEYQKREADREAKLKQLEASATKDSEIEETRIGLEGEQDRMQVALQLSKDFAALAGELDDRASQVRALAGDRKQTEMSSEAQLAQLNNLMPARELALRNLAQLPAGDENNQMIQELKTELTQNETTQKLNQERSQQAGAERQALEAEALQLDQAAAKARNKSANYAATAQDAQANEDRLADRMDFYVARQRAVALLASTSKILNSSAALSNGAVSIPAPSSITPAAVRGQGRGQGTESLRQCIRKAENVDACLAQGGQ